MTLPKLNISSPDWAQEGWPLAGLYLVELKGEKRMAVFTADENEETLLKVLRLFVGADQVKYCEDDAYWHIPSEFTPEKLQQLSSDFSFAKASTVDTLEADLNKLQLLSSANFVFTYAETVKPKTWYSGILIMLQYWFIYLILGLITSSISNVMIPSLTIFVSDPFLCSGKMQVESTKFQYMPGQRGVTRDYFCLHQDGTKHSLSFFSIVGITFLIHFLVLFILANILHLYVGFRPLRELFSKTSG